MEDKRKHIELLNPQLYYDKLLECRKCIHEFECRGPWIYEPWCPEDIKHFTFEPKNK